MKIKSPKNIWAGAMFIGIGLFFTVWAIANYQMGTAVRMGPAYFPTVLGGLLVVLGLIVLSEAFVVTGAKLPSFNLKALGFVLAGCLAYAYLMKPAGLVIGTVALVFITALGGHEFKWKEVAILAVVLVIFSVLVFVKGLTLPFPLWPEVLQR